MTENTPNPRPEFRTADARGRLMVGEDGRVYAVQRHDDPPGAMTLTPVVVPNPPQMERGAMPAVYVNFDHERSRSRVVMTLVSAPAPMRDLAEIVADVANLHRVPVVVDGTGVGAALVEMLTKNEMTLRDVIAVRKNVKLPTVELSQSDVDLIQKAQETAIRRGDV